MAACGHVSASSQSLRFILRSLFHFAFHPFQTSLSAHHYPTMPFNLQPSLHNHTSSDHSLTYTTSLHHHTLPHPTLLFHSISYHKFHCLLYLIIPSPSSLFHNLTPTSPFPFPALAYTLQLYLTHLTHPTHIYPTIPVYLQPLLHNHTSSDHSLTYTTIHSTTLSTTTHYPTIPNSSIKYPTIHFTAYLMPSNPALHISFTTLPQLHPFLFQP